MLLRRHMIKRRKFFKDEKAAQKEVDDALAKLQKAAVDLEMKPSKEKVRGIKESDQSG